MVRESERESEREREREREREQERVRATVDGDEVEAWANTIQSLPSQLM